MSNVPRLSNSQRRLLVNLKKSFNGGKVLDVGAGAGFSKIMFGDEWKWEGIDIDPLSDEVHKGDAHSLNFEDEEFDMVVSIAVFEHLHSPWIAIKEISRVLKKGGIFFGTVAFLEPEHGNSYFHMTKRGMSKILEVGNLEIIDVIPTDNWTFLTSLNLFPLPLNNFYKRIKSKFLFSFRRSLIKLRIALSSGEKKARAIKYLEGDKSRFAGSFTFMAKK
tara:strand:+ start:69 stop:725 length:657 start_codon:yes stop_codon:yes gene_type:complete